MTRKTERYSMRLLTARVRKRMSNTRLRVEAVEEPNAPSSHPHSKNPDEFPCPVCGGTDFLWGETLTPQVGGLLRFKTKSDGFWKGGRLIKARECYGCGNVLLFTRGTAEAEK